MSIKALLPVALPVNLLFLDDTGSDNLGIFEHPDLQALQIPPWPAYCREKGEMGYGIKIPLIKKMAADLLSYRWQTQLRKGPMMKGILG